MTLKLNTRPDAYGWIYGDFISPDGEVIRVDIMPPVAHWDGDMYLEGHEPHGTDWVLYADGEVIGRVTRRDDLEATIKRLIE